MSTAISVWSRVLTPGQDALVSEEVSVQITNIVLEFDESKPASEKRSVLKMQHLTASPALLRAAAAAGYDSDEFDEDDDSEIDSDEFGELEDDDDDEEEEDDEDEAMADTSKVSKASTSSKASKAAAVAAAIPKVNGDVSAATAEGLEGDEDDEDDEDDSDDEFDEEFERQEAEVQICSFIPGRVEQFTTNLILPGEEDFVFKLSGEYKVHLFGHYIMQPVPGAFDDPPTGYDSDEMDYDSDEDEDDEDDDYISESELGRYDPETGLLLEDDEDDENEEEDDSRFMEIEEAKPSPKKVAKELPALKKEAATAKAAPAATTKAAETAAAAAATPAETAEKSKLSKNQLKKLAKKEKAAAAGEAPAAAAAAEKKETSAAAKKEEAKPAAAPAAATKAASKKQTLPSGLVIEDNKTGTGSIAKSGNRVQMRYIGRLANGKIFDQNTKGAPFSFKLGKGEVIKGWDQGIAGMAVGGERKLVIPAALAYGKQAISGIPPNSTLTFEVKLLSIK